MTDSGKQEAAPKDGPGLAGEPGEGCGEKRSTRPKAFDELIAAVGDWSKTLTAKLPEGSAHVIGVLLRDGDTFWTTVAWDGEAPYVQRVAIDAYEAAHGRPRGKVHA